MNEEVEELIYTQTDMDAILAKLRAAELDAEQSKQLLWAVVDQVGGEVAIAPTAWLQAPSTKELEIWDDPGEMKMHLKVRETVVEDE